ncbi:HAMP domain-containing sensor histidine kinase [Pedobacter sp. Hv1]|uniref:sensor histidine kinase n=1 Tax=Pedobacter sp. Hv1 TaxID=1740090 RepID=UPI0006D8D03D|nr:HAMP domain-containing sensor histidine kinase [Pedobacter sp. Hv1]KQC00714.1 hypothetical protein AQF98_08525 [Pedobacter sp. Hv1]
MRLLSKISYYHFGLSVVVLGVTGFIMFLSLRAEISKEIEEQLELQAAMVAEELQIGKNVSFPLVQITKGNSNLMKLPKVFTDTLIYDKLQNAHEGYYYFKESKLINGNYYRIRVMTTYIGWGSYSRTISYIFLGIAALLTLLGTLINYLISRGIWRPLLVNLRRMKDYSVSSDDGLQLISTDVKEFKEMNAVMVDLAERGKKEYMALKQFTENASHEIQTPLSILKTRLESISQLPLEPNVVHLLGDAKTAVTRLSKVSTGLLLLAKLENDTFVDKKWLALDEVVRRNLELQEDLFEYKQLNITLNLSPKQVFASTSLMDILISNLLANMLNNTNDGANVAITLDHEKIVFSNTGIPLSFPESKLFTRFTKGAGANTHRNGLGLSIVKQICSNNNWKISYNYKDELHIFEIEF